MKYRCFIDRVVRIVTAGSVGWLLSSWYYDSRGLVDDVAFYSGYASQMRTFGDDWHAAYDHLSDRCLPTP